MNAIAADYVTWWAEQMLGFLPERFRRAGADASDAIIVEPQGTLSDVREVALLSRRGRLTKPLGRFALDAGGMGAARRALDHPRRPSATHVSLPSGVLIEKRLDLPLAAERELDQVVAYEMDHETPFSADEVWWICTVENRDRTLGKLALRLSFIPRAAVVELVATLDRATLRPTALEAIAADGAKRIIPLSGARQARSWTARAVPFAAAACAALALAVAALPFLQQALTMAAVERRIAQLTPAAEEAAALRQRLDATGVGGDVVAAERARLGDPLAVLAAATGLLPDDTYLTEFSMRQRKLALIGQSADAAKLIGVLAGDPAFTDPAFSAPVTRKEGGQGDGFSISAEAKP
jgi:general secretion pathway protein L